MRFVTWVVVCALASVELASADRLAAQQASLDLSGTWVLNVSKSDFDMSDPPKADTSTYTKTGNVYEVVQSGAAGQTTYRWPVGAGEVTSALSQGATMRTTTTVKGDTTLFTSEIISRGVTMMIETGRDHLSSDGHVLTRTIIHQNLANPNEDALHFVFVYDKK
jgi:hypothetical protein